MLGVWTEEGELQCGCLHTLIEQRRKHKHNKNKSEYNRLRNLVNIQAKEDKKEWPGQYCEEIENQFNRGNTEKSYNLVRTFFGKPKIKHIIESKEGKTLIEEEEIEDRWQQYTEELYNGSEEPE